MALSDLNLLWLLVLLLPCLLFCCVRCVARIVFQPDAKSRGLLESSATGPVRSASPSFADTSLFGQVTGRAGGEKRREEQMLERITRLDEQVEQLRRVNPELRRRVGDAGLAHRTKPVLTEKVKVALTAADMPSGEVLRIVDDPKVERMARQARRAADLEAAIEALQEENRDLKRILAQDAVLSSPSPSKQGKTRRKVFTLRRSNDLGFQEVAAPRDEEEGLGLVDHEGETKSAEDDLEGVPSVVLNELKSEDSEDEIEL